ncbi:MAG: hypothetical protein CEE43_16095 [Promethearchaeota archaeon Loki_b32]|nr:MAG: hypothetical protein CEE43_16095 [Candidatus Lokiarchaeota archaeon Loki_b32]
MERKQLFRYLGVVLVASSIVLTIISISLAFLIGTQKLTYFEKENIDIENISVKMRDGISIKSLIYVDKDLKENDTNSIPTILLLHGINGRKEHKVSIIYQFVKLGYAVISVEQRGHGESGGPSGFLGKEPDDMIEVIDFIENNYDFANTSHMGLLGFSYGGGIGAILQAKDDRINAVVLYHPLSSLDSLTDRIPIQNLIGSTTQVTNIDDIQDAFDVANVSNSQNLLLLQGQSDKIIEPQDTQDFYNHLNGTTRNDIELKLRPSLGHEGNEKDETSLKYSIAWFEHFFHNSSINILDLDTEINKITLINFNFPQNIMSEIIIIVSAILLFMGLSVLILKNKIIPYWDQLPIKPVIDDSREGKAKYNKMLIYRSVSYLGATLLSGILFSVFNSSLLYGYFIFFPIIIIIIMLFIPSELHSSWKVEWKSWINNKLFTSLYSLSIVIIPTIYFIVFYNLVTQLTMTFTIPFIRFESIPYLVIGLGSGSMDYLYLREMKGRHPMILMIIRPLSLLIFLIFVPVPPFPILGGIMSHIFFIILMGIIIYFIRNLVMFLSKFYKNIFSMFLLVMLPFVIFYFRVFFRII